MKRYLSLCLFFISVLTFNSCSDVPAPYTPPGTGPGTYISETFNSDFGSFTPITNDGGIPWVIDFKTAKASGYDNTSQTTTASEGWLISDAIDLTNSTGAYIEFDYILRYVRAGQTENKVLVSTDFFGDVNTATWIDITGTLTEGADWSTFYDYAKNLPAEVIGKNNVNIALYYSCTTTSSTWEVKNLKVKEGQVEVTEDEETPVEGNIFSEAFNSSLGNFTIKNVKEATGLDAEVWQFSSEYSCAKATSYTGGTGGQNIPTESWLISPVIDLANATSPILNFEHAGNYFDNIQEAITFWITEANTENWTQLNVTSYPSNSSFAFVNSGDIDLTAYVGKSIQVGFKYVCESKAGTYELKNFVVKEKTEEEVPSGPVIPVVPVEGDLLVNGSAEAWNGSVPTNWVTASTAGNATLSQSQDAHTGNYSILVKGASTNKRISYKETTLKAGTYTFKFYAKATSSESSNICPGYTPITDGKAGNYEYGSYTNDLSSTEWKEITHEFTLTETTTICLLVMNHKNPGKDFLIDDLSLTTTDGGLADGSNDEDEDTPAVSVTYTKVTTISAGTYIIAANVDGTQKVATPLGATANYGYLKNPVDGTLSENTITLNSTANEFTIEATDGGYTIKDGNNKYYSMAGTYNSFNVGTTLPEEGAIWNITFNEDGTANIVNTTMNKTLQYDTAYTSYGAYDTVKAILPSLYKKN